MQRVFCGAHCPFFHISPSKVHSWSCLQGTFQRENGCRKVGRADLAIQSSQMQVLEQKLVKGKGKEKSGNPRASIQSSFPQCCARTAGCAKLQIEYPLELKETDCFKGCLECSVYFVVHTAPSSTSPHPKFILGAVYKELFKGKMDVEKQEELILPSKVHKCRFWNRNL